MKTVTMYEAADGSRYTKAKQATIRDMIIEKVEEAMAPLGPQFKDEGCHFANGRGWIKHDPAKVKEVKRALIEVGKGPLGWWYDKQLKLHGKTLDDLMTCHGSWFGRMLDGSCAPLERAWSRMCCITEDGREFGQPYYAANPDKTTGGEL